MLVPCPLTQELKAMGLGTVDHFLDHNPVEITLLWYKIEMSAPKDLTKKSKILGEYNEPIAKKLPRGSFLFVDCQFFVPETFNFYTI